MNLNLVRLKKCLGSKGDFLLDPFHAIRLFRYLLKTSKNFWFSGFFRGYWKRPGAWNRLNTLQEQYVICPIDKQANNIVFICKKYYVLSTPKRIRFTVFAWNAKRFAIACVLLLVVTLSASFIRNIGEFGASNHFTNQQTANTKQLFVPLKRNFFRSILF